jgi:general secretion pathway protein A
VYEAFYRLKRAPFSLSPDPKFLYLSPGHLEALAGLEVFLISKGAFCCLLGEPGLGKSTLARAFLDSLDPARYRTAFISPAAGSWREVVAALGRALGGGPRRGEDVEAFSMRTQEGARNLLRQGGRLVVAVDEAQLMPLSTLEALRLFVDALSFGADPVKLILIGPPELEGMLRARSPALRQRLGAPLALVGLGRGESLAYLAARIRQAGGAEAREVFTPGALRAIAERAGGTPRVINALANLALIEGFAARERPVGRRTTVRAMGDLALDRRPGGWGGRALLAASLILIAVPALALYLMFLAPSVRRQDAPDGLPAAPATVALARAAGEAPAPPAALRGPLSPRAASLEGVTAQAQGLQGDPVEEGRDHLPVARP